MDLPVRWRKPRRIFVNSMSDLFHEHLPDMTIARIFQVMLRAPRHTYQILTKRPERMQAWVAAWVKEAGTPLPANIWLGVSVEDQATAKQRVPLLLDTPCAVRWVSAEPLLGPVALALDGLNWVVVGGESGPGARPMHPDWARRLRDDCVGAGVAFLFKQWGDWLPDSHADWTRGDGHYERVHVAGTGLARVGKKRAGRELDGRLWDEYPA
jgi:protein gp37